MALVKQIEKKSGLHYQQLTLSEYRPWKKGWLEDYRRNPNRRQKLFLKAIDPFINIKTLIIAPILLFITAVLLMNIWFNWQHHQFVQKITVANSSHFYKVVFKKNDIGKKETADIFVPNQSQAIIKDLPVLDSFCREDAADKRYHYYFFPYDQPYCFNHFVNLDEDDEAEIIYRLGDDSPPYRYGVYDFDRSRGMFTAKSLRSYSNNLDYYVNEVSLYSSKQLGNQLTKITPIFAVFLIAMLVLLSIKREFRKELEQKMERKE